MMLQLQYNRNTAHAMAAAFITGASAVTWLKEISRWNIPFTKLECYVMPESIRSVNPAGLLVVFNDAVIAPDALEPYAKLAGKIFIPVHSNLAPQVSDNELYTLLTWEYQFYHPAIGLVGFEKKDKIDFGEMLQFTAEQENDWSYAHPGLEQKPAFSFIQVKQPTVNELMDDFKQAIAPKPLKDIPEGKEGRPTTLDKFLDKIKWGLNTGALSFVNVLGSLGGGKTNENGKPGALERLQEWLTGNIIEIEKKRNEELNRLLKLFEDNTDEALRYAIPLSSPFLDRGMAKKTSTLARRSLKFNLGNLGGGGAVDNWDIGDYYHDLRTKYLAAAQKEIEKKDFKKAAYVYAHLLGDYHAAANVLEQGKFYRDAAALHKDYFKNDSAAAECLERGGLYIEAIELYGTLNRHEKVGDLYTLLQQKENAGNYYEQTVDIKVINNDYLDAARVIHEKMQQPGRAKHLLLDGWKENKQSENCLKKYFDLVNETEDNNMERRVSEVYRNHTAAVKRELFLHVLQHVDQHKKDKAESVTYRNIAYEIVSSETERGNSSIVHQLKNFIDDDKLVGSDCSRYASASLNQPIQHTGKSIFQLDETIQWLKAVSHRNQFVAVGIKNNVLHLARGNWYGNIEHYSWSDPVEPNTAFTFIHSPYYKNHIILTSSNGLPVTEKYLPANKYFGTALTVNCPAWLHKDNAQSMLTEQGELCRLQKNSSAVTLYFYSLTGDLKHSFDCSFKDEIQEARFSSSNREMIQRGNYYYTCRDKTFLSISENGEAAAVTFDTGIRLFAASHEFTSFSLVISTNKGCLLCKPEAGALNIQGDLFAQNLIPCAIVFLSAQKFLVIQKSKALLFCIEDGTPRAIKEFTAKDPIVAALPSGRNQFALLERKGRFVIYDVE